MQAFKAQLLLLFFLSVPLSSFSQDNLSYYLPNKITYDLSISKPHEVIGFGIGEWHLSYEQFLMYAQQVAQESDRVVLERQGFTYERKPTSLLIVTHPDNHARLDKILEEHRQLSEPEKSDKLNVEEMPVVVWMGYSIHGNEASGFNSTPLWLYHLAAAQDDQTLEQLRKAVILIDPCFNPDGTTRFATWVNSHRSSTLVTDRQSREFDEAWPNGRTNHYWFDMNRDWLLAQHPETKGRLVNFQKWKPNILTDHHEMGTDRTFFFQPGIPSRNNPMTPAKNTRLTEEIATFHAHVLDSIGSLYYSKESFDDFYYGKGSTYPDIQGSIGILFEQASARGHAQESLHGTVTFPFAIRNQLMTSFSTLNAAVSLKDQLLGYQRTFRKEAMDEAAKDTQAAYVFGTSDDPARTFHFMDMLNRHEIAIHPIEKATTVQGIALSPGKHFAVPVAQPQYKLLKTIFDTNTTYKDSLFYDVSTWTMPLAFGLEYAGISAKELERIAVAKKPLERITFPKSEKAVVESNIGYAFSWSGYYAPRAANRLLKEGILIKTASKEWTSATVSGEQAFGYGSIIVPVGVQSAMAEKIHRIMETIAQKDGIEVFSLTTGLAINGVDLGSPSFEKLKRPTVALLVGERVSPYEAGEVWHLFDQRYQMPITLLDVKDFDSFDLSKYNTLIMVDGNYSFNGSKLKAWVKAGNTLITTKDAAQWAVQNTLSSVIWKRKSGNEGAMKRPYAKHSADRGAQRIGGAIFEAEIDISHPLCYGFTQSKIPVFRNHTLFAEPTKSLYATPIRYTTDPLMSGYISDKNLSYAENSAAAWVSSIGSGKVICLLDNPNFRAFWYGTNKLMANAVFFGHTISNSSTR